MSFRTVAQRRATVAAVTLALLVLGSQQVLRTNDSVLGEMHPAGCPAASVGSLSARPWDHTTPVEIAVAVEAWHAHGLAGREPISVERVAPCAARLADPDGNAVGDADPDERFANAREVYLDALRWRAAAVVPFGAFLLALAGLVRRRVSFAFTAPVVAIGVLALWAEKVTMAGLLDQAWASSQRLGTVDATGLDTTVLNVAGTVRWLAFGAVALLVAATGFRAAVTGLGRAIVASRGVRLHAVVAAAFAFAMLVVPQSADAVRRWGVGQTVFTIAVVLVLASAVAFGGERAAAQPEPPPPVPDRWSRRAVVLAPIAAGALASGVAGVVTDRRGLLVPAVMLGAAYLLSLPLASGGRTTSATPPPDADDQRWLLAAFAGVCPVALGLLMVRVGATDRFVLREPPGLSSATLTVGLALVGLGAVVAIGLHRATRAIDRWIADRPGRALACVAGAAAAMVVPSALLADPARVTSTGAAFGSIAIFTVFLIDTILLVVVARSLGALLTARSSAAIWAVPPVLRTIGVGRPPFVGFLVVWAVLSHLVGPGSYHDVRLLRTDGSAVQATETVTIDEAVDAWIDRQDLSGGGAVPAVVVAASGGGLRSAYWTAAVLDCVIEAETVGTDPCAGRTSTSTAARRRARLLTMSGVSGGSLGLASYVAAVDGGDAGWGEGSATLPPRWYDRRLGADFQAPILARMLFGDLPEVLLRNGAGTDRAVALERAWEAQWPDDAFSQGFLAGQRAGEPLLVLSGLAADDGCRFNVSELSANGDRRAGECRRLLDPDGTRLLATADLGDYLCADTDLRRSTAALLSARFPLISPSGRLVSGRCHGTTSTSVHVIDGGYRESAAASTVVELLPALQQALTSHPAVVEARACPVPIFVQLDSADEPVADRAGRGGSPNEAMLPVIAVNRARDGVEVAARTASLGAFTGPVPVGPRVGDVAAVAPDSPAGDTPTRWFRIAPTARPGDGAPLGWSLADATRAELQAGLAANRTTIELVRSLLDGDSLRCDLTVPDGSRSTASTPATAAPSPRPRTSTP